jgi:hypothetical protein
MFPGRSSTVGTRTFWIPTGCRWTRLVSLWHLLAVFRIGFRIKSGFNQVNRSGSRSRRAKITGTYKNII